MLQKDIFGLHHIGIYVVEIQESIDFYTDILGFHLGFYFEVEANNGFLKIAMMRKDNFNVELLQLPDTAEVKAQAENTWNHFAMYVADIDKAVARLRKDPRIVFEMDEPGIVEDFGGEYSHYIFFRGINGERIELVQGAKL